MKEGVRRTEATLDRVGGQNVYWTPYDTTFTSGQSEPWEIAVDDTSVYWTNYGNGTVMKMPLSGGVPILLAFGQSSPTDIAVDATNVYSVNEGNGPDGGSIMKLPKN